MKFLGQDLQPAFSVIIQESSTEGMLKPMLSKHPHFIEAIDIPGMGTRINYLPYGVLVQTMELIKIPKETQLTREKLANLLKEFGFHPLGEG